jgi:hypothetical protein
MKRNRSTRIFLGPAALAITFMLAAMLPGCIYSKTRMIGMEPHARPMEQREYEVVGESEGESNEFRLFFLLKVTPAINMNKAIEDAIIAKGGDNLIEVSIYRDRDIWAVGSMDSVQVKGKVIRYKD